MNILKTTSVRLLVLALGIYAPLGSMAQQENEEQQQEEKKDEGKQQRKAVEGPLLIIHGTNQSASFTINAADLHTDQPIQIMATNGFSVTPASLPANAKKEKVTVTFNSSKAVHTGQIVLRSGATRAYVQLKGLGTPLPTKDIAQSPVYKGGQYETFEKSAKEGFKPANKGYTIEFKVNADSPEKGVFPYMVDGRGVGLKGYVTGEGMGLYSSTSKKGLSNPLTSGNGGLGKFYNDDKRAHVYRYAVAPDNRVFIYRDGYPIDTVRAADYGPQANFAAEPGNLEGNLLKNPDFEGDYDTEYDNHMAVSIEGWDVVIGDRYNSEQYIVPQEISNEQDFNNHVLQMKRYKWSDGWGAAEIAQVVDVVPNETYTLQALVRGGIKAKEGTLLGKIKIQEVQDNALGTSVDITSDDWETYSMDYTTSANCKQIRVLFYLERDKWGANITPLEVDNVKLTGRSVHYTPKIGFENHGAQLDYFTYDLSGAYAPEIQPRIEVTLGK